MAKSKNRNKAPKRYEQTVFTEKRITFVGRYLSPKGQRLLDEGGLTKEEADQKYGKNRYRFNSNAKPMKTIVHTTN